MADLNPDVIIFRARSAALCRERALVLRAMNIEHAVLRAAGSWMLLVPAYRVQEAMQQLEDYARENRNWPKVHPTLVLRPFRFVGVIVSAIVLGGMAALSGEHALGYDWFAAGRVNSDLVRDGEWWRTVTSLTLHVDAVHLVGNLVLGSVFAVFAGRLLGGGLAWFSIVLAGAIGNEVSALVQLPGHTAVGASTAVFATLGLVGAYVWRRRHELPLRWPVRWAPIVVAALLLAFTGSGGARTDVVSHLTGFLAGLALGAYYGGVVPDLRPRTHRLLGGAAIGIVLVCWAIALGTSG